MRKHYQMILLSSLYLPYYLTAVLVDAECPLSIYRVRCSLWYLESAYPYSLIEKVVQNKEGGPRLLLGIEREKKP